MHENGSWMDWRLTGCSTGIISKLCWRAECLASNPRRGVKIWLLVTLEAWLRTVTASPPRLAG
jgi:hypothetical protein